MTSKSYCIFFLFFFVFRDYIFSNDLFIKNETIKSKGSSCLCINKITFKSDVPLSKEEFLHLTGLKSKTNITYDELKKTKKELLLKKRFFNVDININYTHKGYDLHFILSSNWLFKKLSIKGVWFDKHQYANLYQQQAGDVFDILVHEESIKNIKNYLYRNGYFNCLVKDELIYEKFNKTIIAKIFIDKRSEFFIEKVTFELPLYQDAIKVSSLEKRVGLKLLSKKYSRSIVEKEVRRIRKFFKKQGFLECHISIKRLINKDKNRLTLILKIKLDKKINISFIGNNLFSDKKIRQEILGLDYPSWFYLPEIICEQLIQEYHNNGYLDVKIDYQIKKNNNIVFKIKENDPTIIEKLIIKESKIILDVDSTLFFYELLNKGVYDENLLQKGISKLKSFYKKNGFWDFEVLDTKIVGTFESYNYGLTNIINDEFISTIQNKKFKVVLFVNKGVRRLFGGCNVEGFKELEEAEVFKKKDYLSYLDDNKNLLSFDPDWLHKQQSFLLKHFQQQGYWYVFVQPKFIHIPIDLNESNEVKTKTSIHWKVELGPRIKFGKVIIDGDTRLPFYRILKEMQFKQGDLWDYKKLEKTRRMLKRLDIFKHIQFQPHKISKEKNDINRPVILNLIDDDPLQARLRLGYFLTSKNFIFKRSSTYKVGTSLVVKNLTSRADKLILNADFTRWERKLNADYQIPYPFNLNLKDSVLMGKCKLYANKYTHPVQILQSGHAYEAIQNGVSLGLSNEYNKGYFCGVNAGNEWVKITQVRGNIKFNKKMINKTLPFFFLEPSFLVDKLDDRLDVKNGNLTFFSLKFMIPERKGKIFTKLMFEESYFNSIYKNIVLGLRLRFGHIFNQKFNQILPNERFYLGGPYSVRGYEKDSLPPVGILEVKRDGGIIEKEYTIQGGNSMINGNIEFRFPIYKLFRGVIFQDIGILSQSGFPGFKGCWYPSTGFGFRYKTPIGALRFDIGWKWKHRFSNDGAYAWYLTLGEAF
ncbi:BamA/TamA family outer membrane protein [Candidatus Dependentiae bacterium]